jgi:hypothetical protein
LELDEPEPVLELEVSESFATEDPLGFDGSFESFLLLVPSDDSADAAGFSPVFSPPALDFLP